MKLFIGSDHAGFDVKGKIIDYLREQKFDVTDLGTHSLDSVDYPDIAEKVAKEVVKSDKNKGILICGSGVGMSMAANKIKGIRAALCYDTYAAEMSKLHNDSNILCLRARETLLVDTKKIVEIWLKTEFSNEARHKNRIDKISKL